MSFLWGGSKSRSADGMLMPSPTLTGIIQLSDDDPDLDARYVEFPEDTYFLESMAIEDTFDDGVAYVPTHRRMKDERGKVIEEVHIYKFTLDSTEAEHVCGPLLTPDGKSSHITVFGSALSSTGILYVCAFNRNSVLAYDLSVTKEEDAEYHGKMKALYEIRKLPAPNDVCIDHDDETVLYVACGTFQYLDCCLKLCPFSNATYGQCFKVNISSHSETDKRIVSYETTLFADGLRTLAGVEKYKDTVWLAELYQMNTLRDGHDATVVWKGNDESTGDVWMSDNVDIFHDVENDTKYILSPAYSTVSEFTVEAALSRPCISSIGLFAAQMITAASRGENLQSALRDPEVNLSFSNTFIKEGEETEDNATTSESMSRDDTALLPSKSSSSQPPVRLIFMKPANDDVGDGVSVSYHFEINLISARNEHEPRTIVDYNDPTKILGRRHYFNEQVTHASHMIDKSTGNGYITCVNFEQPRILLLSDKPFLEKMK